MSTCIEAVQGHLQTQWTPVVVACLHVDVQGLTVLCCDVQQQQVHVVTSLSVHDLPGEGGGRMGRGHGEVGLRG